jgi:toxin-antitoxin system PIN domain toxin
MFVVDTNLLTYAANRASPHHTRCLSLLGEWQGQSGPWFLTWGICYEFLRVSTNPRVLTSPLAPLQAWSFLESLLASPGLSMLTPTEHHAEVLAELLNRMPHISRALLHDAEIAVLMREHGVTRIYTHDAHFHQFPFVEPLDPLVT